MPEKERDYRNREISWREIDQRKDRSSHVSGDSRPPRNKKEKDKADWLRKMALKEANKHFQGKQGTADHENVVSTLHEQFGTRKFQVLAKQYLDEYGLPNNWGTQFLFLDYEDPEVIVGLLKKMAAAYPERSLREQQAFLSKLRTLKVLAEDGEVQDQAAEVLSELS